MGKKTKAFVYQLISFAILFIAVRYLVGAFTTLKGLWVPLIAFVVGTVLAPKFQAVRTKDGEKLFMKWIFLKGIRELK
ncbi:hypothetical protein [Flavobacterium sp.]|uniref:hypothetical protein n=1 Tax=Flavobacterium sp. TaxID=239 RepID=UPI003752510B